LVLTYIAHHVHQRDLRAIVSVEALAAYSGKSVRTVGYHLSKLEEMGELAIERGGGQSKANIYRIPFEWYDEKTKAAHADTYSAIAIAEFEGANHVESAVESEGENSTYPAISDTYSARSDTYSAIAIADSRVENQDLTPTLANAGAREGLEKEVVEPANTVIRAYSKADSLRGKPADANGRGAKLPEVAATPIPKDFRLTQEMRDWALAPETWIELGLDGVHVDPVWLRTEHEVIKEYYLSQQTERAEWEHAWKVWIIREVRAGRGQIVPSQARDASGEVSAKRSNGHASAKKGMSSEEWAEHLQGESLTARLMRASKQDSIRKETQRGNGNRRNG
jgi:hypothetical protein